MKHIGWVIALLLLASKTTLAAAVEKVEDTCQVYDKYASTVKNGGASDEQKLMQLTRHMYGYHDEYASACENFENDKHEYQQRIFAYTQNHFLVTPSLVVECTTITGDDTCDGDRDWTDRAFLYMEFPNVKTPRRPTSLKSDALSLPYSKSYISDMEGFVSFANYQYRLTAVYYYYGPGQYNGGRMQHVKLSPGVRNGNTMTINGIRIKELGTITCHSGDSCSWLTAIYQRDNNHYLKAIWYY
ncbi:hypothetical protein [Pseudocitrobacter corydidari]|uniref:Uncharacterized protein n=1 Tax=Pseudocitrobacter corydidari TaxID=2891570 RepID=A0ABY3S0F4_9ENTR|nr:hypothetical protein [Pseudocitrobacter corydidari]UGS40112.1 hypothetical protein G163CM_08050 [Pseudocitrobacter corydidari]